MQELVTNAGEQAVAALTGAARCSEADAREQVGQLVQRSLAAIEGLRPAQDDGPEISARAVSAFHAAVLSEAVRDGANASAADLAAVVLLLERAASGDTGFRNNEFTRKLASADGVNAVVEIAHDMRSPLTSILFLVETLRRGRSGPVTTIQERQLGLIYGAALGLNTLACDVIDAVRGGQRLVDGRPIPFSVAEVILGVCDTVLPISEEKGLPITHVLPSVDGRIGYPGALGRVLLNLMTNALKYTNEGSVTIGATELGETRMSFWVSDTGQGIPASVMSMLFDGFRPSANGMRFSNAGLGLAICQDFLRSMGTSLQVESSPDAGTRFSFEIDLWRA